MNVSSQSVFLNNTLWAKNLYLCAVELERQCCPARAISLYTDAVELGYSDAMVALGKLYEQGKRGVPQDTPKAVQLYFQAADLGNPTAMVILGTLYEQGQNDMQARRFYTMASQLGSSVAMSKLGIMFEEGRGGLSNTNTAEISAFVQDVALRKFGDF